MPPEPAGPGPVGRVPTPGDGIVVVDKPTGWTSHDVVARIRRLAGTRRVGHAGTLDPMATGVLVVGIGRATRLLGHISGHDKAYTATIRLGVATTTDDAQGEPIGGAPADGIDLDALLDQVDALTGPILQRPSSVSAIKVDGRRAHARVRAGEQVQLQARPVLVSVFDIVERRCDPAAGTQDLDVEVTCSSGTYVRALARDLGDALGVGGHLTALRRTRVGGFDIEEARTLDQLAEDLSVMGLDEAAHAAFPVVAIPEERVADVRHGRPIDLSPVWAPYRGLAAITGGSTEAGSAAGPWSEHVDPHALLSDEGQLLALVAPAEDGSTRYLAVFAAAPA